MPFLVPPRGEVVTKVEPTLYQKLKEEEKKKADMLIGVYQRLSPEEKILLGQNPEFQNVMRQYYPELIQPTQQFQMFNIPPFTPEAGLQAETNIQEALIREIGATNRLNIQLEFEREDLQEKYTELKKTYEEMLKNPSRETELKLKELQTRIDENLANIERIKKDKALTEARIGQTKTTTLDIQDRMAQPSKFDLATKNATVLLDDILTTNPKLSFKDAIAQMPATVVTGADLEKLKAHYNKLTKKKPAKKVGIKGKDIDAMDKELKKVEKKK